MELLNTLLIALLASGTVGSAIALFIQLGKIAKPNWFPDGSADNWRLGSVLVIAVGIMIANFFNLGISMAAVERFATAFNSIGITLLPLLILFANWIAKATYLNVLKGVKFLGKSWTK